MLPRALTKQNRRRPATPAASTQASTGILQSDHEPVPSTSKAAIEQEQQQQQSGLAGEARPDRLTAEQRATLVFDVEAALSDYGLFRIPEMLQKIKSSKDGRPLFIHCPLTWTDERAG